MDDERDDVTDEKVEVPGAEVAEAEVIDRIDVGRKLAVLGSPISHSKSPALHNAAYAALGLDWSYEAIDVTSEGLAEFVADLGEEWRGLSLTMPLKQAVIPLLDEVDRVASVTGAANTVVFDRTVTEFTEESEAGISASESDETDETERAVTIRGFNTDVAGIIRALAASGLTSARYVLILGGGATAASALVAAAELGAERVVVAARSLERSVWLEPIAHSLGLMIQIRSLAQADRTLDVPDLVVSTIPGGASADVLFTDSTRRRATLFDVSYDPWPSPFARAWSAVGGTVVSGLAMLAHQALLQVRVFVSGDPLQPLDDEAGVLAAMLEAVGIDEAGAPLETVGVDSSDESAED